MSENIDIREVTTNDRIPFNFTYYAMKLLGRNLYSNPWTAISEIVANGIDAKAPNIYVLVDMRTKDKAEIEIFDSGYGMTYLDLCEKYTLIGRNKRLSSENIEGKTLGRKGIGKLAALYLSPKYYLITKTSKESSAWCVDTTRIEDTEIPTLNRCNDYHNLIIAKEQWNNCQTGTMIHLTNVDLTNIGYERLKSLYAILTDYYIPDLIDSQINICVLNQQDGNIVFKKIEKNISFETMCAIFDNTDKNYSDRLPEYTYLLSESKVPELDSIKEKTVKLDVEKFQTQGSLPLTTVDGEIVDASYALKGWIGIHSSLESKVLARNSAAFKKLQMHPNALRLYVRGKLAVSNLMNYIASSQALANYIEGEISFDILDDDRFEDASTSNREGYSLADPRIVELIKIVKKIITTLMYERVQMGANSNKIRDEYFEKLRLEEERKKEEAEKKAKEEILQRKMAEVAAQQAILKAQEEESKRLLAEKEKNLAKKQTYFLEKQLTGDDKIRAYNTHVIKSNANAINDNLVLLLDEYPECKSYDEIRAISLADQKILTAVKYYNQVAYGLENKKIQGNVLRFIKEYVEEILSKEYISMNVKISEPLDCIFTFPPQDITVSLENIFSNAKKHEAKELKIDFKKEGNCITIQFANDGEKLPEQCDRKQLFEFGYSTTSESGVSIGTGIGLYQIYDLIVCDLGGKVDIFNNDNGVTLEIKIYED